MEESWWKRAWTDTDQNNTAEIKSSNEGFAVYIPLFNQPTIYNGWRRELKLKRRRGEGKKKKWTMTSRDEPPPAEHTISATPGVIQSIKPALIYIYVEKNNCRSYNE